VAPPPTLVPPVGRFNLSASVERLATKSGSPVPPVLFVVLGLLVVGAIWRSVATRAPLSPDDYYEVE